MIKRKFNRNILQLFKTSSLIRIYLLSTIIFIACNSEVIVPEGNEEVVEVDDTNFEATDWTTETHSNDAYPNFEEVFEDKKLLMVHLKHPIYNRFMIIMPL